MKIKVGRVKARQPPTTLENVSSILICTDSGAPIVVLMQLPDGGVFSQSATEPGFAATLDMLGESTPVRYERFQLTRHNTLVRQ